MKVNFANKLLAIILVFALVVVAFPFSQIEAAGGDIKVVKDGKTLSFDVAPKIIDGRTMVPYQVIAKELGGKVSWDNNAKSVTVTRANTELKLTIGYLAAFNNGQRVILDTAPVIVNGRTLVPLRFISEEFGLWVDWNDATRTVTIDSSKSIKHAMGTTKLTKAPERVVVLYNGMVDISLALGVKPVGAVESWLEKPWYLYLRNRMTGVKNLGSELQPNLEAIAVLKPDLIIGAKVRHEKIYGQLSDIAPTVMTESVFDWKGNMEIAALAMNKKEASDKFIAEWNTDVAAFKKKMGSKLNTEVSIIRFEPVNARIYYSGFAATIFEELGLARPESQRVKDKFALNVTQEQIPLMDGDIIFNITSDYKGDGEVYKTQTEWTNHALWKNLKAVKNNKVFDVNEATWNMSGGAMAAKRMLEDLYFYFDLEK
jgi:iron complex transport system substrate-binding protein